ncbi:MAG TPA: hypothetical protein VK541_19275 [Pedobacter sp.]|uniref:hypothetical protein n=1 Tax=Pedobacter sp. TaxID=1411316 RepID=UPI002C8559BF|nr:hypothetical protein [Pedobacter sp.]HMI04641.1 hypothetical protein [Pedobacter sp.]
MWEIDRVPYSHMGYLKCTYKWIDKLLQDKTKRQVNPELDSYKIDADPCLVARR